jgi:Bystin
LIRYSSPPAAHGDDETPDPAEGLDPKVVEVYAKYVPSLRLLQTGAGSHIYHRVGQLLRSYRAGPLPKPFKIIPSLPAWARILALTAPEQWSPHAAHAATRIFISNMKPPQARVFLEGVILGLVRADLEQPLTRKDTRKLSPHLYEALKRALYKPAAFFKGIVFPLLDVSGPHSDFCLWLMWFVCVPYVGWVHAQGGGHHRIRAFQSQSAAFALFSCAHPSCRYGLLGCVSIISDRDRLSISTVRRADFALHTRAARQEARAALQGPRHPRLPLRPPRQHTCTRHAPRAMAPKSARALPALRAAPRAGTEGRVARCGAHTPAPADRPRG